MESFHASTPGADDWEVGPAGSGPRADAVAPRRNGLRVVPPEFPGAGVRRKVVAAERARAFVRLAVAVTAQWWVASTLGPAFALYLAVVTVPVIVTASPRLVRPQLRLSPELGV